MYFLLRSIVAPCLKLSSHVHFPIIIPHQIPIYFDGFTHETSPSLFGGLLFRVILDDIKSLALLVILIVLQGVLKGTTVLTLSPLDQGAKSQ